MIIAFILTMPGVNSWNGKWSGDGKVYAETRSVRKLKHNIVPERFSYNFGDGWRAAIETRVVTAPERRQLLKRSAGFCGYQWMIESIVDDGDIYGPEKPKPADPTIAIPEPCAGVGASEAQTGTMTPLKSKRLYSPRYDI